jgi:tRNA isopentenyl-2-thiomethyl-A-37 hydroxylase MiaE
MISFFSNTFKVSYFEYLVRSSAQHFTDLVVIAERIEQVIVLNKIANPTKKNDFTKKRKETETHNIGGGYKSKRKNYKEHLPSL